MRRREIITTTGQRSGKYQGDEPTQVIAVGTRNLCYRFHNTGGDKVTVTVGTSSTEITAGSSVDLAVDSGKAVTIDGATKDSTAVFDLLGGTNSRSGHMKKRTGTIIQNGASVAVYRVFNTGKESFNVASDTLKAGCSIDLTIPPGQLINVSDDAVGVYDRVAYGNTEQGYVVDESIRPGHFDKPAVVISLFVQSGLKYTVFYRFQNSGKSNFEIYCSLETSKLGVVKPGHSHAIEYEVKAGTKQGTIDIRGPGAMGSYELLSVY